MTQNNISVFAFLGSSLWCSFVSLFLYSFVQFLAFMDLGKSLRKKLQGWFFFPEFREKKLSQASSCATVNPVTQCTDTVGPGTTQD